MKYVDGYVIPVPKKNLEAYKRMARRGSQLWKKHGTLEYKECLGDDLETKFGIPFSRITKAKPDETIIFSYIVFKSKAHRDRVNAKVMKEMEASDVEMEMPFDMKRMTYGGFTIFVDA